MRILVPALVLLLAVAAATQTGKPASSAKPSQNAASQTPAAPAVDQAEIDALKADLRRMNATLDQMRTNLGYVGSTTQPLRHQFELEIDMWQLQLGQMQRRLIRMEAQSRR